MEVIRTLIGMDVHKRSVYITEMEENGEVKEQYEIFYENQRTVVILIPLLPI